MNHTRLRLSFLLIIFTMTAMSNPDHQKKMHKDLNLTDSQQEQFGKISFELKKTAIELKAKVETSKLELHRLMTAETIDKSAIEKKMKEISNHQVALRMNFINAWSEKNKILNPDQQKLWKKKLVRHPRPMRGKMNAPMMNRRHQMRNDMHPPLERRIEKEIIKK